MTISPHTCAEFNATTKQVCGAPARFLLELSPLDDPTTKIKTWKCPIHIRRYTRSGVKGHRMTITATKGPKDASSRTAPGSVGTRRSPRSRA